MLEELCLAPCETKKMLVGAADYSECYFSNQFDLSCYGFAFDSAASPDGRLVEGGPFLEKTDIAR